MRIKNKERGVVREKNGRDTKKIDDQIYIYINKKINK